MPNEKSVPNCFIIMPITTPDNWLPIYHGDKDHFEHVLNCLFIPAIKRAGFKPIPPKMTGSEVIQAEIIKYLATSELVLCDISISNPNVYYEFGIRTSLDMPVVLISDDKTTYFPFDTSIINRLPYDSSLSSWKTEEQIDSISKHIIDSYDKSHNKNTLWKYFGIEKTGELTTKTASLEDKIDIINNQLLALRQNQSLMSMRQAPVYTTLTSTPGDKKTNLLYELLASQQLEHEKNQILSNVDKAIEILNEKIRIYDESKAPPQKTTEPDHFPKK